MTTLLKLGPADHGRPLTLEEFLASDYREGHQYELIEGRLYVSAAANLPADFLEQWISDAIKDYARARPDVINYCSSKARVFVPGDNEVTAPEPDFAAFANYPRNVPIRQVRWRDVSPVLVVEVLSEDDPDKDLDRNVRLYRLVPSIQEYWIIDPRPDPDAPSLTVHRRGKRNRWRVLTVPFGSTYETPLLPGFSLVIDPRAG